MTVCLINSVDMLQSEIKIVELQFHKLQRIIIYFDCGNYTLTHQLHVTIRMYANVCTSCTFVVTVIVEETTIQFVCLNIHSVLCY